MSAVESIPERVKRILHGSGKPSIQHFPSLVGHATGLWSAIAPNRNIWAETSHPVAIFNFTYNNDSTRETSSEEKFLDRVLEPYREMTDDFAALVMVNKDYLIFNRNAGDMQPWPGPAISKMATSFELRVYAETTKGRFNEVLHACEVPQTLSQYRVPYNVAIFGEGPEPLSGKLGWELTEGNVKAKVPVWKRHHGSEALFRPRGNVMWRRELVGGILNDLTSMLRTHSEEERAINDLNEISKFYGNEYGRHIADLLWLIYEATEHNLPTES